jgi:hypothetical protein
MGRYKARLHDDALGRGRHLKSRSETKDTYDALLIFPQFWMSASATENRSNVCCDRRCSGMTGPDAMASKRHE